MAFAAQTQLLVNAASTVGILLGQDLLGKGVAAINSGATLEQVFGSLNNNATLLAATNAGQTNASRAAAIVANNFPFLTAAQQTTAASALENYINNAGGNIGLALLKAMQDLTAATPVAGSVLEAVKNALAARSDVQENFAITQNKNFPGLADGRNVLDDVKDAATGAAATNTINSGGAGNPGATFILTTGNDQADTAGSFRNGNNPSTFKFTGGNEIVNANNATLANVAGPPSNVDQLADGTTTDNDILNFTANGGSNFGASIANIETFNLNVAGVGAAGATFGFGAVSGLKTINLSGGTAGNITLTGAAANNIGNSGVTTIDASAITTNAGLIVTNAGSTNTADTTIKGTAIGANNITGGLGNDTITTGTGADTINGGAGADNISAGAGNDTIEGGSGNDTIDAGAGNDTITDAGGDDTINAGAGNDTVTDTAGTNTIDLGDGTNTATLGAGKDTVSGGSGVDTITTGGGNDVVTAKGGNDVITLTNTATAANSETLVFEATASANGNDTINNFLAGATSNGGDVLNVSAFTGGTANYVEVVSNQAGGNNVATSNVIVSNGTFAATQANGLVLAKSDNIVFIETNAGNSNVFYITTDANGTIVTNTQVASIVGLADATTLVAAQVI